MIDLPTHTADEMRRLRDSIDRHGVLVPIVISAKDGAILDGLARDAIARDLGLKRVPRVVVGGLKTSQEATRLRIELNTARRQLSRVQLAALIKYHLEEAPHLSDRTIADKTGCDHKTVGRVRRSTGEIPQSKRQGKDGRWRKPIVQTCTRSATIDGQKLLTDLDDDVDGPKTLRDLRFARWQKVRDEQIAAIKPVEVSEQFRIRQGDFRVLSQWVGKEQVDLVWCDPPWVSTWRQHRIPYAKACASILKPGGILLGQSGVESMIDFAKAYEAAGLTYCWTVASIRRIGSVRYDRIRNQWCPILIFTKGANKIRASTLLSDVITGNKTDKSLHPWQSPVSEYIPILSALTGPGALIADIAMGSGTTVLAVATIGQGRRFIGGDLSAQNVKIAKSRVNDLIGTKKKSKAAP